MEHWENIARLFSGMSRLDTTSTSAHLWSGWIIIFHLSQKSKFFNLRPCMAMLKRFCYQSYHQTGVTSCTVIIHPWCFTVFTGFHHAAPLWPSGLQLAQLFSTHALAVPKQDVDVENYQLSKGNTGDFHLFHEAFPVTHHTTLRFRAPKLEQKNDNQRPKKYVETRLNMLNTPNVQTYTNMMHIQSAPHQGLPLGSPGRVLSCTVVAGSRHDTLTVIGATFNPLSRRWELESLPKQKRLLVSKVFTVWKIHLETLWRKYFFRFKLCRFKMVLMICFISDIFIKLLVHADLLKKVNFGCMYPFNPSPSWAKLKVQSNHDPSLHFKEGTQDF